VENDILHSPRQGLVPSAQAWFWTGEWQERERQADEAIARGELSEPFESIDDLLRHLHGG